jgi:DNA-binding NtrC family response regulator
MSLPRLIVLEGPDAERQFLVPAAGGGIGRGEQNAIQLSDLAVSRAHATLRLAGDAVIIADAGGKSGTFVNGKPITEAILAEGDQITVGKTRLAFIPADGGVAVIPTAAVPRVSLELPSRALLVAGDDRPRRHLSALARLGDGLRQAADRPALLRLVCEVTRDALRADRAMLLLPEAGGRLTAQAIAAEKGEGQLALAEGVVARAQKQGHALVVDGRTGERSAIVAPLPDAGLLYADRAAGGFDETDLSLVACVAHLCAAALDSLAARATLAAENRTLEERFGGGRDFVGDSPATRELKTFMAKVAPTDSTVLLLGESGSGKEMVASAIHYGSRRAKGPFVCISCAVLTDTLLESELFGHEKGAFTGASERKAGRFELAHAGSLFLDEVGELTPRCQTKLLRVLEERTFERVGGTKPISVDVRVIAATNRDLAGMVKAGSFREDLYYRLSVIQREVPPLRARREDIPILADHFLGRVRYQTGRRVVGFAAEAMRALLAHPWPGNCRELKNAVERAVVLGEGELVRLEDLPPQIVAATGPAAVRPPTAPSAFAPPPAGPAPATSLRELERQGIARALLATGGNKAQAAAILEIDRSTLYKKLKEYGIEG